MKNEECQIMNIEHGDGMETVVAGMAADYCVKAPNSKHQAPENIQAPNSKRRRVVPAPTSPSRWSAMPIPERFKLLRLAVGDAVVLQRGGHYGARLQLEREWLELDQQKYRDARAAQQECQKRRDPKLPLSDEDRKAIADKADEILGLK
jgi:hypothetical protein